MADPRRSRSRLTSGRVWNTALALILAGFAAWAVVTTGRGILTVGASTLHALWLLPALCTLSLLQLFLSAIAWQGLLPPGPGLTRLYRLRIVREGIDSLLPVAQVGGEIVAARLLSRNGLALAFTGASVLVDVTLEFLTQLIFLLIGVTMLALTTPDDAWEEWTGAALLTAGGAAGLLSAQRFGLLRLLEALAGQIAKRWPGVGGLDGMEATTVGLYRRRGPLLAAAALHLTAWVLGCVESWAVLQIIAPGVTPGQALVVEALGMAARSAGFAVPGALVVQETGFALAAASVGLPETSGLSLSLVKRAREIVIGLLGLLLWRLERRVRRGT